MSYSSQLLWHLAILFNRKVLNATLIKVNFYLSFFHLFFKIYRYYFFIQVLIILFCIPHLIFQLILVVLVNILNVAPNLTRLSLNIFIWKYSWLIKKRNNIYIFLIIHVRMKKSTREALSELWWHGPQLLEDLR